MDLEELHFDDSSLALNR